MSSARSSFLSCGCCFSESHSAFLFPSVYPFPFVCMKPTGHPPFAPSRRRLRRSPFYTLRVERKCSVRCDTCRSTRPWEERRVEPGLSVPRAGPEPPGRPSAAAPAVELRPCGNLSALCPPLERPSSPRDWSPTRQALVARPRAAASSCGEVGRRGRFWNPEHGLKQVGSPPRLHF